MWILKFFGYAWLPKVHRQTALTTEIQQGSKNEQDGATKESQYAFMSQMNTIVWEIQYIAPRA